MSEERRKISLRSGTKRHKNRPVISAPRQISAPIPNNNTTATPGAVPRPIAAPRGDGPKPRPPQSGSKVLQPVSVSPLPPRSHDRLPAAAAPIASSAPVPLDVQALRDPGLVPDQYVAKMLSDASEQDVRQYEEALRKVKLRAGADLQQNIYQNRTQFIKISKEAEKLKGEMRTLRNLMAELKTNTTALRSVSSTSVPAAVGGVSSSSTFPTMSKRDKRSSVADRSVLWNAQMQALYKNVEGSQKFLPMALGRHVVQNAGPWIELDNATYKSRRAMQLFLLNDHLLVASRKKRKTDHGNSDRGNNHHGNNTSHNNTNNNAGPPMKLVADRCWPLLDIEVVDMAGTSSELTSSSVRSKLADAIMVRGVGQETVIYRTEKPEDPEKAALLLNLRKVVEELRRGIQSEMEANNKAKETINYFASRDPGLLQKADLLETLSDIKDMLIEVDGKQQNLRWVESQMDELDIAIALQQCEPAVARVEQMQGLAKNLKNNVVAQDFIAFKVEERAARLAALVLRDLVDHHNDQRKTRRHVQWLARLGYQDRAREAYLAARTAVIQRRARQCVFQGDLHLYIWQLAFVYFSIISNTVRCFQTCFPPPAMSVCVRWAKDQVDAFNVLLARQLSSTTPGGPAWQQCMDQAREHARMLTRVGLDFRNLVGQVPGELSSVSPVTSTTVTNEPVGLGLSS